ncbi:hypothetical protein PQX77_019638 [Marasmius sp. AFHP31]|nr:hypothetical protein PQX77_019638 [Marasmius sp. AFHP31]
MNATPMHVSQYEGLEWDNVSNPWNLHTLPPAWSSLNAIPPTSSPASPDHPLLSSSALILPPLPPRHPCLPRPLPQAPPHWVLHPKLLGISICVMITHGKWKKKTVFVTPTSSKHGATVHIRQKDGVHLVGLNTIGKHSERPKPNSEQALMIVMTGDDQHNGKFVRRIFYFYNKVKPEDVRWFIVGVVDHSERQDRLMGELLELPPTDLEIVEESKDNRDAGNVLFEGVHYAAKVGKPEVRRPVKAI